MTAAERLRTAVSGLLESVRHVEQRVPPHVGLRNLAAELVDIDLRSRQRPIADRLLLGASGVARILGDQGLRADEMRAMVDAYRDIEDEWTTLVGWGALSFDRRAIESCAASPGAELADAPLLSDWRSLLVISAGDADRRDASTVLRAFTDARRWRSSEGRSDAGLVQLGTLVTWLREGRLRSVRIDPDSTPVVVLPNAAARAPERAHLGGVLAIKRHAGGRAFARSGDREFEVIVAEPDASAVTGPGVVLAAPNAALANVLTELSSWEDEDE